MKIRNNLPTLILLVVTFSAGAQTNYVQGYTVSNSGDTIRGFIERRMESGNYHACWFREDNVTQSKGLYPASIKSYSLQNRETYVSVSFTGRDGEVVIGFFKVVVQGEISLLEYESRYFARDENGKLYEITMRKHVDGSIMVTDIYGIGILKLLMQKCDKVASAVSSIFKTNQDLKNLFQQYNTCRGVTSVTAKRVTIKPYLSAGVTSSISSLQPVFTSGGLGLATFKKKYTGEYGAYLLLFVPKISENVRFGLDFLYGKYNGYSFFVHGNASNDVYFDCSYLRMPLAIRINSKKYFLSLGFQSLWVVDQRMVWRNEEMNANIVTTVQIKTKPLSKLNSGYIIGAGRIFNVKAFQFSAEIRYSLNRDEGQLYKPDFKYLEINLKVPLINKNKSLPAPIHL